jgi:NitT/TauT family transport system permease protein
MSFVSRRAMNSIIVVAILLVIWELLYLAVGEIAMRSPIETIVFTVRLVSSSVFWPNLEETAKAFGVALFLSVVVGLAIGFALGLSRVLAEIFEPMLVTAYSIPKITLYPIVLLVFGLGLPAKIAFGAIHGFIPISLFTIHAVRNVRPVLVKSGRVMRLRPYEIVTRILLPSAMPEIFSGIRIGFSLTLLGTLLGEMFASQRGLGFLLTNAIGLHNIDLIMALTLLLTVFAGLVSTLLLHINRRFSGGA